MWLHRARNAVQAFQKYPFHQEKLQVTFQWNNVSISAVAASSVLDISLLPWLPLPLLERQYAMFYFENPLSPAPSLKLRCLSDSCDFCVQNLQETGASRQRERRADPINGAHHFAEPWLADWIYNLFASTSCSSLWLVVTVTRGLFIWAVARFFSNNRFLIYF